jgi:hypothetical protein
MKQLLITRPQRRPMSFSGLVGLLCATLACSSEHPSAVPPAPVQVNRTLAAEPALLQPPSDAQFLCSGHVTGAPLPDGSPGRHISWNAFTSHRDPAILIPSYLKTLGASQTPGDACATWRVPVTDPRATLQVCPATSFGPWRNCHPIPAGAKSIVLTSTISGLN